MRKTSLSVFSATSLTLLLAFSPALAVPTKSKVVKPAPAAAKDTTKEDVAAGIKLFCSLHAAFKDIEVIGLAAIPGAAIAPTIVTAICAALNTQLASNTKGLTAPPSDLPVKITTKVPVFDPSSGKTNELTVRVRGVFNPIK